MNHLVCSFFGHRKIEINKNLKQKVTQVIENLITKHNVLTFLFGSKSNFDELCLEIVCKLKEKYLNIKRIVYTCKSQGCYFEKDRKSWEAFYARIQKKQVCILCFDEEFEHKTKYNSNRACYVERNYAMINDSNYCVFYYDKNYKPQMRKNCNKNINYYQPKSGTALAYAYAKQKKKYIINVFD